MADKYLFSSERLGFRNWTGDDLPLMTALNADEEVMTYFPGIQSRRQTSGFIARMQEMYDARGYCYFATETLADGKLIGFIGLAWQTYELSFAPCVDMGWRLARSAWGRGYATEGAKRCLAYAFETLGLSEVFALAPEVNIPSVSVMQKSGMQYYTAFRHPVLKEYPRLETCVCYRALKTDPRP